MDPQSLALGPLRHCPPQIAVRLDEEDENALRRVSEPVEKPTGVLCLFKRECDGGLRIGPLSSWASH